MEYTYRKEYYFLLVATALMILFATRGHAAEPGFGPNPELPKPEVQKVPTMKTAKIVGWKGSQLPKASEGLKVEVFAEALDHPRWVYVLPNGDVLVAESNAPANHDSGSNAQYKAMKAGMGSPKSANRIILLRGVGVNGRAQIKTDFITGLNSPLGMALIGSNLYVANTDAILRFTYEEGQTEIKAPGEKIVDLPAGDMNHHWTKSLVASLDGKKLYVGVGSNSNIADNKGGMQSEGNRANILEVDIATRQVRVFASGLRNPVGMDWEPHSKVLWTVVNERDLLGNDLVPDYLTAVRDGDFFGWPYSYFGQNLDPRVKPQAPELVKKAIKPDYALGGHTASLGLAFAKAGMAALPKFTEGAFIGQHGSWNRNPLAGYKVIFVPFKGGKPAGDPQDVLTGFLNDKEEAMGRPVGVAIGKDGALLVADDGGNVIWRVSPSRLEKNLAKQ